jgi:hypothetical protein
MGTYGSPPTRVLEVPAKWTRHAISPADLQVGPKTLSTTLVTVEDWEDLIQIHLELLTPFFEKYAKKDKEK